MDKKNRPVYQDLITHLDKAIAYAKYTDQDAALMYIIFEPKEGTEASDKVAFMLDMADILQKMTTETRRLFQLHPNTFCFLLTQFRERKLALALAKDVIHKMDPFCKTSVGLAGYPIGGTTAYRLLHSARTSCLRSYRCAHSTYHFFKDEMQKIVERTVAVETDLHNALQKKQFLLHYQPQISFKENRVIGVEALIRWQHPELGLINPGEFIAVAEQTNLIFDIGKWILNTVCSQCRHLSHQDIKIAINIAPTQLASFYFVDSILETLQAHRFPANRLELEITEGEVIRNLQEGKKKLAQLAKQGIEIAIDDYGTGYSSLSYIKQLKAHRLKLDKSFIDFIPKNKFNLLIVKSTIELAHNLGLTVLAEGIEKKEQLDILMELGCDEGQGYYFSKPLSIDALEKYLAQQKFN